MNDVYSSKALKPNKCRIGYIEVNGVCVPISRASSKAISPPTPPPTPPTPPPTPPTPPTPPIPPTPPPTPEPPAPFQPRSSDLGLQVGTGIGVAGGIGAAGYGAYRNRGAIQRNYRRLTQPKVKVDEEQGLLDEEESFFRSQQERTGLRVRSQQGIRNRLNSQATRSETVAERNMRYIDQTPREYSFEMDTIRDMSVEESEGFFEGGVEETKGGEELAEEEVFGGVEIEPFDEETALIRNIQRDAEAQAQAEELDLEQAKVESMEEGVELQDLEPGLSGGAEEPVELMPITEEEIAEMTSNTALIDDIISTQTEEIADVAVSDAFLDTIVAGAGEEAVIGADIATTGALAVTETALMVAPELAAALVVGGVLYGVEKGVETIFDVGASQDKKYHDKRNDELGTHEMDKREIDYKLKELDKAKKYYTDQVEHHNFGDNPASKAQHEKDKAMLASINQSIDAIHNQQRNGVPVYSVVSQTGFDANKLSSDDKKAYDRLVKRVDDEQEQVDYHGADKTRLNNRKRKLDTFVQEHSDSPVPIAYVNKASDEELETITNDYIQNGGDIFTDIDPIMIDALGIGEAIGTDEVQNQRIQVEETQKNEQTTDDVAASQGLKTGGGSVA